jgi:hypothetical protein
LFARVKPEFQELRHPPCRSAYRKLETRQGSFWETKDAAPEVPVRRALVIWPMGSVGARRRYRLESSGPVAREKANDRRRSVSPRQTWTVAGKKCPAFGKPGVEGTGRHDYGGHSNCDRSH